MSEKKLVLLISLALLILFLVFSFLSDGAYQGGDNYAHYKISRYSWLYPHLFLDHWGKPLFTFLSSPFAQLGFNGIKAFNVIAGIVTAYLTYRTSKAIELPNSWLAIPFVIFSPIYFVLLPSALTEITFSCILILSVYLFFKNRFIASAVIISFLPFTRTEGIIILPFFFLAFLINRKYKITPLLLTGFIFYSIIGSFHYNDIFWLIHNNPYTGAKDIYGQGELLHFIKSWKLIGGIPLGILMAAGILGYAYDVIKSRWNINLWNQVILILCPFIAYLAFHSILWWKGWGSSLGLIRVIAGVIPLCAIISLKGLNVVIENIFQNRTVKAGIISILLFLVVSTAFKMYSMPVKAEGPDLVMQQAAQWLKKSPYYSRKIHYHDPLLFVLLDLNPYDRTRMEEYVPNPAKPEEGIAEGTLIVWDAHFSANEGRLSLDNLLNNKNFKMLNVFRPEVSFKVLGGYDYEVYIFEKVK